jgi:oxygen-dependent protoporphyrinogen oxidase
MNKTTNYVSSVVVVGGGISGLATAHRLWEESRRSGPPVNILLLEGSSRLGGVISTVSSDGFLLEGGPDSFISDKPWAMALARRIGLSEELIGTSEAFRRSFIVKGRRLVPVPEGFYLLAPSRLWPFLTTAAFSWPGKLRMAMDLVLPRRIPENPSHDESLGSFVRRRFGREALERMAQPMVGGIYTADPEELSLRATMPRFLDWEQEYRSLILAMIERRKKLQDYLKQMASGPRYGLFVSLRQGMEELVAALQKRLPADSMQLNTEVKSVAQNRETRKWILALANGERLEADAVCLALPAYLSSQLLEPVRPALAEKLRQVKYASTATVNLAYRLEDVPHPMNGFGFVVPLVENREVLACTFGHVKFPGRAPAQHALMRAFMGGALQPQVFEMEDNEMIGAIRKNLRELLGIEKEPLFTRIERHPLSMAQYRVGHLEFLDEVDSLLQELPGLRLAGNGFTGIGVPDCVRRGEECAEQLLQYLGRPPSMADGGGH